MKSNHPMKRPRHERLYLWLRRVPTSHQCAARGQSCEHKSCPKCLIENSASCNGQQEKCKPSRLGSHLQALSSSFTRFSVDERIGNFYAKCRSDLLSQQTATIVEAGGTERGKVGTGPGCPGARELNREERQPDVRTRAHSPP